MSESVNPGQEQGQEPGQDPAVSLADLLDATADTWSATTGAGVTVAAITDGDVAAVTSTAARADAVTLMKLAQALINAAVEIDPGSARLIGAEVVER